MTEEHTPMYAPENWPTHRMEVIRFVSILADSIAKHGRHHGLTEFIASIQDLPKGLMAGMIGILLIDLHDHERRDGETTLLSVPGELWDEIARVLGLQGLRIDPQPGTWRPPSPIYSAYTAHPVHREQSPEAGPSPTT